MDPNSYRVSSQSGRGGMDQLEATSVVYLFGGGLIGALFGMYTRPHFDRCRSRVQGPLATAENSLSFELGDQGAGVVVQGPASV